MPTSKKGKPKTIFAVIGADDNLLGYFKDMSAVEKFFDKESVEEAVILEVVSATDASYPPDPELELTPRDISSLLDAK